MLRKTAIIDLVFQLVIVIGIMIEYSIAVGLTIGLLFFKSWVLEFQSTKNLKLIETIIEILGNNVETERLRMLMESKNKVDQKSDLN